MVVINKKTTWLAGIAGSLLALAAMPAMAQMSIPGMSFPAPGGDKSLEMLGTFLGGSGGIPGSADVMKALMQIFNGAVLSLASIVAFYTIVSAVVQTAHDGEVLGKRYSSLWVPIRAATGVAAIVPASGFSAVQIMVLWVAAQGVGLADTMYNVGIDAVAKQGGFVKPSITLDSGKGLVADMAKIGACIAANQEDINKSKAEGSDPGYTLNFQTQNENDLAGVAGDPYAAAGPPMTVMNASFDNPNAKSVSCGTVTFTMSKANGEIGAAIAAKVYQAQVAAAQQAMQTAASAMLTASASTTQASAIAVADAVAKAGLAYNTAVNRAIDDGLKDGVQKAMVLHAREVEDLKAGGWATAGGSFMSLSKFTAQLSGAAFADAVSVQPNKVVVLDGANSDDIRSKIEALTSAITKSSSAKGGAEEEGGSWIWKKVKGILDSNLFNPIRGMTSSMTGGNPLTEMKSLGDILLSAVAGTVLAIVILQAAGGGWANLATGGGAGGAMASFMLFFTFILIGMLTMGITMATYIPMVPYIIWLSVLISWMIAVTEAVIASPLWMLMHINPEGEGFANASTETGYKFVAAVFLRPGLSVISFFVASSIMFALGKFINETFFKVVDATQSNSMTGLFSFFGFMFVYTAICITLVQKSFALCLTIPEAILRWIGSSLTGGENMEHGAHGQFGAAAGVISGAGSNAMRPRGGKKPGGGKEPSATDTPKSDGGAQPEAEAKTNVDKAP